MTILEALTAAVNIPGVNAGVLRKACIDSNMAEGDVYTSSKSKDVDLAAVSVLKSVIVENEKEGGFSYQISKEALSNRVNQLLQKHGLADDSVPKITGRSPW